MKQHYWKRTLAVAMELALTVGAVPLNPGINLFGGTALTAYAADVQAGGTNKPTKSSFDFSTDPTEDGWTFIDYDGDGHNWAYSTSTKNKINSPFFCSQSYDDDMGAFDADNWAITPAFTVSTAGDTNFRMVVAAHYSDYPDSYAIYVALVGNVSLDSDSFNPDAWTELQGLTEAPGDATRVSFDLAAYAGQEVYVAIRHQSYDMYWLDIDNVVLPAGWANESTHTWFDFSTDPTEDGWTFIDHDGDGHNWAHSMSTKDEIGSPYLYSQSYDNDNGAFDADNWAITPAFTVNTTGNTNFHMVVASEDHVYLDSYAIYVALVGNVSLDSFNPDAWTELQGFTEVPCLATQVSFDLAAYAGQEVYVAIRHKNYDKFWLVIDDVVLPGSVVERTIDIADATLTFDKISVTHTGKAITPELTVTYNGTTLTEGEDYEIADNSVTSAIETGDYAITINGIGDYSGTASAIWQIVAPKQYSISVSNGTIQNNNGTTGTFIETAPVTVIGSTKKGYWTDANGNIVSYKRKYKIYAMYDTVLTWNDNAEQNAVAVAGINLSERTYNAATGKTTVKVTSEWNLPAGATIIEAGTLRTASTEEITKEQLESATYFKKSTLTTARGTFYFNINLSEATKNKTIYAMTYVKYSYNGTEHTLYSNMLTSEPIPEK